GRTVELRTAGGTLLKTTTTDANGNYVFASLAAGSYRVDELLPSGWVVTTANPVSMNVSAVGFAGTVNFGNFQQFSITGEVFGDTNGNGALNTGEPGLTGWTVFIDANGNGTPDPTEPKVTTGAGGTYTFSNLGPGTYTVKEVLQAGFLQTTPTSAVVAGQSGTNVTAANVAALNFGNYQAFTITGTVFDD